MSSSNKEEQRQQQIELVKPVCSYSLHIYQYTYIEFIT